MKHRAVVHVPAHQAGEGHRILMPDGTATAPIMTVEWQGRDAEWAVLTLDDLDTWEFPRGHVLAVLWHEDSLDVPAHVPAIDASSPVAGLLQDTVAAHPADAEVRRLAAQVSRGYANPPGMTGVAELARSLYLRREDGPRAVAVSRLIADEPFRRDYDRWTWVAQALAILHHLAVAGDDPVRTDRCRRLLSGPPGAPPMAQRGLDDPPLHEDRIAAAAANDDLDSELHWRSSAIVRLMQVRASGLSRTLTDADLTEMIDARIGELRSREAGRTLR